MTSITAWNSVEGLPKQFVKSLRVLFDILDEQKCGYVRLQDIESRWHEEGVKGLPSGVTDALRKVTPQNGYLSFDRFVAGLKLALLTSRSNTINDGNNNKETYSHRQENLHPSERHTQDYNRRDVRRHSQEKENREDPAGRRGPHPKLDIPIPPKRHGHNVPNHHSHNSQHHINTAAVKPNNVLNSYTDRNNTMRRDLKPDENYQPREKSAPPQQVNRVQGAMSPSCHSLDGYLSGKGSESHKGVPPQVPPRDKSKRIINELKNWQQRKVNDPQPPNVYRSTEHLHYVKSGSRNPDKPTHGNGVYGIYLCPINLPLKRQRVQMKIYGIILSICILIPNRIIFYRKIKLL